jgi:hypothetical protein
MPMTSRTLAALALSLGLAGCGAGSAPQRGERLYQGRSPLLPLSVIAPSGWRLIEEAGAHDAYEQIRLQGPRNADATYSAYITIRGQVLPEADRTEGAVDDWVDAYLSEALEGRAIESDQPRMLQDAPARDLVMSVAVPPLFRSGLKPLAIPVTTRIVVCRLGPRLFELIYSADAREYDQHAPVFERVLTSIRFQ